MIERDHSILLRYSIPDTAFNRQSSDEPDAEQMKVEERHTYEWGIHHSTSSCQVPTTRCQQTTDRAPICYTRYIYIQINRDLHLCSSDEKPSQENIDTTYIIHLHRSTNKH